MMAESYSSWQGIAQAIKSQAVQAMAAGESSLPVTEQIKQAHHDRFLSRVFADGDNSEWLLKGGTAMLARVPHSRSTGDLDLASTNTGTLDEAEAALIKLAARDLGDHIEFRLALTRDTGLGNNQPGVQTRRLTFTGHDVATGRRVFDVPIDIVVGPPPIGRVDTMTPANRLVLPKLGTGTSYRLFPISDQIAEKVSATMSRYNGQPSSRVKDLVDLVTIARTQIVHQRELQLAIQAKPHSADTDRFTSFEIPTIWRTRYEPIARATPSAGITNIDDAVHLVKQLVDPALCPDPVDPALSWSLEHGWSTELPQQQEPSTGSTGSVHVTRHVRAGYPVTEHTRSPRGSGSADPER